MRAKLWSSPSGSKWPSLTPIIGVFLTLGFGSEPWLSTGLEVCGIGMGRRVAGSMYGVLAALSGGGDTWMSGFTPAAELVTSGLFPDDVPSSPFILRKCRKAVVPAIARKTERSGKLGPLWRQLPVNRSTFDVNLGRRLVCFAVQRPYNVLHSLESQHQARQCFSRL